MKHHKITYLANIILLIVLSGCSKWLDLKPESEMILDDFWQSGSQAESVVAGCYKSLTSDDCMSRMILWGEGRSDNVGYFDTDDEELKRMVRFDLSAGNKYCKFAPFYGVINYCNTFLYYAPSVPGVDPNFTQEELHSLEAEVLTIRSIAYFYLVRAFKNVPWIGKPSTSDQQNFYVPQSPERDVIDSIINNLRTALVYAPTTYGSDDADKGRVTKNAVRALLADVYLWDMQYENCMQMCNQIIADKTLKLTAAQTTLYNVFYKGNSTESIFELQFGESKDNKQYNNIVSKYYGTYSDISSQLIFSSFLVNKDKFKSDKSPFNLILGNSIESEDDIRQKDFVYLEFGYSTGFFPIFKYSGFNRSESSDGTRSFYLYRNNSANWIVYRLSDIMLMKAEALVQLNRSQTDLQDALDIVNTTYLRSNYKDGTNALRIENYQSKEALEKLVLRERQRELLFEGKRWFDLMRRARRVGSVAPLLEFVSQKLGEGSTQVNSSSIMDALYLPVNQGELDANPELKQNPYYEVSGVYK
jgi:hypothetical protein